ncbi:hypothetical protein ACLQ3C_08115 [Gordonia sp. DT30]|uniref:hypothetical protein n=1 Tax=unclassified Gordonia (in: high G+C Gram-positive bacteria) TaxID=2657482 RepID=UPI003CFA1C3A
MPPPKKGPRNNGALAAIGAGVLAVIAIVALAVTLIVVNTGSADNTVADGNPVTTPTPGGGIATSPDPGTPSVPTSPDAGGAPDGGSATAYALATAMQRYIEAANARNVGQMQAAVCSAARPAVQAPTEQGNLVLERLAVTSVNGDVAQSTIETHLEVGPQRSSSKQDAVSFERENSTWYYCPGAEPAVTA